MNDNNQKLKRHWGGGYIANKRPRNRLLLGIFVFSVITIIGTVSFAYFTATGASSNQTATISTAKVSAVFADADTGANATLNFGESFTKKFTITNNGNVPTNVKMYWKDLVNTYTKESLSYTLSKSATGETGSYEVFVGGGETKSLVPQSETASTKLLANDIEVPVGTTYYELTVTLNYLSDVNQDSDLTAKFYSWFKLEDIYQNDSSVIEKIIASSKGTITNFDSPASTTESAGVYELADEGGTSYYFRGPVENNYVRFGKWRDDEPDVYVGHNSLNYTAKTFASLLACQADSDYNNNCTLLQRAGKDMYWRIIRVNGDGSLRMIYAGTQAYANDSQGDDTFIGTSAFNTKHNDAKYVGYMYAPADTTASTSKAQAQTNMMSSTIKGVLETWYEKNLETDYGQHISKDAVYCYDRSTPGESATGWTYDTGLGYGTNKTGYGAYARTGVIVSAVTPTFICPQDNDKFTSKNSSAEIGNKKLEYPVGLISADEMETAGSGKYNTASNYYLKRSSSYWSGSPCIYNDEAIVYIAYTNKLNAFSVHNVGISVAPVINLTPEYAMTLTQGNGTADEPYHA